MNTNHQYQFQKLIDSLENSDTTYRLLLHSCCAPCSSYVLEYLSEYFNITVLYYNPNIFPEEEYTRRLHEQKRLISKMPFKNRVEFIVGEYDIINFYSNIKGFESEKERGERCRRCYSLRLEKTAKIAAEMGFDYFTTTLSVSPHKSAEMINEIGNELSVKYGVNYLYSNFKKRDGYKQSIELSKKYNLYRQEYCGCVYSRPPAIT